MEQAGQADCKLKEHAHGQLIRANNQDQGSSAFFRASSASLSRAFSLSRASSCCQWDFIRSRNRSRLPFCLDLLANCAALQLGFTLMMVVMPVFATINREETFTLPNCSPGSSERLTRTLANAKMKQPQNEEESKQPQLSFSLAPAFAVLPPLSGCSPPEALQVLMKSSALVALYTP